MSRDTHPEQRSDVGVALYMCEVCRRAGPLASLQGECERSGWAHGRLIKIKSLSLPVLKRLRSAACAVVDQDRSTDEGEARFDRAIHDLWMLIHAKECCS